MLYGGLSQLVSLITDLVDHSLRNMQLPEVDTLVEYLDSYRPSWPSLKADIQNLTSLLSPLIEDQCLPDQRLQLETLTNSQIASREHTTRSLKELFEYSDDYSSFLTEIARSDLPSLIPKLQLILWRALEDKPAVVPPCQVSVSSLMTQVLHRTQIIFRLLQVGKRWTSLERFIF